VIVGRHDKVYYSQRADKKKAEALGSMLQDLGVSSDKGSSFTLSRDNAGAILSFALSDGYWEKADTLFFYEKVGILVAPVIGGFPIRLQLTDALGNVKKDLNVGRVKIGNHDEIYYFASARKPEAIALGSALKSSNYFQDKGFTVILSKDSQTMIYFVVQDDAWDKTESVDYLESLTRQTAPSIGGLPVTLGTLNKDLDPMKQVTVH
jgi:hypothetical protein